MDYKNILRKNKLKVTPKRIAVLAVLEKSQNPLDIEEIRLKLNKSKIKIDQVTIYRIIENFMKINLVNRFDFQEGKFRYELAIKPHHHHVICRNCGRVKDVEEKRIEEYIFSISKKIDYKIDSHILELFGLCNNCR